MNTVVLSFVLLCLKCPSLQGSHVILWSIFFRVASLAPIAPVPVKQPQRIYGFYRLVTNQSKTQHLELTTHLLSIERDDWPKLHDMFKACDANVWQREFPVGFPVEVSALNSIFINIFHDVVACIESRCMIKAKHVLLVCWFIWFCAGKTALALKRKCNFSLVKSNKLTDQQDMFFYKTICIILGMYFIPSPPTLLV